MDNSQYTSSLERVNALSNLPNVIRGWGVCTSKTYGMMPLTFLSLAL